MVIKPMHYKPADWLVNLTRLTPKTAQAARFVWPWRHSVRLALAVTLPMLVGVLAGEVDAAIMVSLGALLNSVKVQSDPYRVRFRNFLIVVPIAMSGFMLGSLVSGHGLLTLLLLILVAILSGLISGYGAAYSTAAMQMLILAVIAGAGHVSASFWQPALLFAGGAALAALLLAIEALFDRHLPERLTLAHLLRSLAQLARTVATPAPEHPGSPLATPFEQQRRHVTDAMLKAYSSLLKNRLRSEGSSSHSTNDAAILSTTGMIFSALVAGGQAQTELHAASHRLEQIAHALEKGSLQPPAPAQASGGPGLGGTVDSLCDEIWPGAGGAPSPAGLVAPSAGHRQLWPDRQAIRDRLVRLVPGRDVVVSALQLALCLAIAFAAQTFLGGPRSYWIPLCVVIVLKPDFGSVFVRAVQRSIGTILGVAIGVIVLTFVPKGPWLLACMAGLGLIVPVAGLRSYALQCTFLTPLVLILIDMSATGTADFGPQRLIDTLIGSVIVLVFGYLIWPRDPASQILRSFAAAMTAAGTFFRVACQPPAADPAAARSAQLRETAAAYRSLSNVRTTLQRALAEPPPASREAAAWFPAVVEAERLCDRITRLAQLNLSGTVTLDPAGVERRLAVFRALRPAEPAEASDPGEPVSLTEDGDAAFQEIDVELARLSRLLQRVS